MERQFTATTYIVHENRVLLLLHPKWKCWLPPGGHLEANETPDEAARREVLEETGLQIEFIDESPIKLHISHTRTIPRPFYCAVHQVPAFGNNPPHEHIDFIYVAKPAATSMAHSPEGIQMHWFTREELAKLPPGKELLPDIHQVVSLLLK